MRRRGSAARSSCCRGNNIIAICGFVVIIIAATADMLGIGIGPFSPYNFCSAMRMPCKSFRLSSRRCCNSRVWSGRQCGTLLAKKPGTVEFVDRDGSIVNHQSTGLRQLEQRFRALAGVSSINLKSPQQVAQAIFGDASHSTSRAVLLGVVHGENDNTLQRQLSQLVLEYRSLIQQEQQRSSPAEKSSEIVPSTSADNQISRATLRDSESTLRPNIDANRMMPGLGTLVDDDTSASSAMSPYEMHVQNLFAQPKRQVDNYWTASLLALTRPTARNLVWQLDTLQCPMGFDPLAQPYDPLRNNDATISAEGVVATSSSSSIRTTIMGSKGSFLGFCRDEKRRHSQCIVLTRCGDFYETFGIDAILLVEHAGLNPMAGKAKAGCPYRNVQATLDALTVAGYAVAVYEEASDTDAAPGPGRKSSVRKTRYLAQIVTAASPTYLYDLVLSGNHGDNALDSGGRGGGGVTLARPFVGVLSSATAGYTVVEVSMEERSVSVHEQLTPEAVACRLAAFPPAEPLIYVPSAAEHHSPLGAGITRSTIPFLPRSTRTTEDDYGTDLRVHVVPHHLVEAPSASLNDRERARKIVVSTLLGMVEGNENDDEILPHRRAKLDDFVLVASQAYTAGNATCTHPLYLETATQLGLMNDKAIPNLVSYLVPSSAPAATRRFLRRYLLMPPPTHVAAAMATLVQHLRHSDQALPTLNIPPVGKVLSLLRAGQASAHVYGEILKCLASIHYVLTQYDAVASDGSDAVPALMTLLEHESRKNAEPQSLRTRCEAAMATIEDVVCTDFHSGMSNRPVSPESTDRFTKFADVIPSAFFERNEATWRGRIRREADAGTYQKVDDAARRLAEVVALDFYGKDLNELMEAAEIPNIIMQDIFNNLIALKQIPVHARPEQKSHFFHPRDRNNKVLSQRYTTHRVQDALDQYVSACEDACEAVKSALVNLSASLFYQGHVPAIEQSAHASLILSTAYHHAAQANRLGWHVGERYEADTGDVAGHFVGVWPYWMAHSEAVGNNFVLDGMWLLTAPNMSGKSTLMRSTASAALLTVCGLAAPFQPGSKVRIFDYLFVRGASADVPAEGKSAFGAEMGDIAALLRVCGSKSLTFTDEIGRATSPRDGTRLAAAILESMALRGMSGIFATHLHDIFSLLLEGTDRISHKCMSTGEMVSTRNGWSYLLQDGTCIDSMALVTAAQFGLPDAILQRARSFAPDFSAVEVEAAYRHIDMPGDPLSKGSVTGNSTIASQLATMISNGQTLYIPPGWNLPNSLDGRCCAYVLELQDGRFYVGESENFRQRLEEHRSKGGRWATCNAIAMPAASKSEARTWESRLIRQLAQKGAPLLSHHDGRTIRASFS